MKLLGCSSISNAAVAFPGLVARRAVMVAVVAAFVIPGGVSRALLGQMSAQEAERLRGVEAVQNEHSRALGDLGNAIDAVVETARRDRKAQADAHKLVKLELEKEGFGWLVGVMAACIAILGGGFGLLGKSWFRQYEHNSSDMRRELRKLTAALDSNNPPKVPGA